MHDDERITTKDNRAFRANAIILYVVRLVVTILVYAICCFCHGRSFSGIDYAGHGVWGWIGLWFSCAFAASIISLATLWVLKLTPRSDSSGLNVPPNGTFENAPDGTFNVLLSRHVPNPIIGEISAGAAATLLLYVSLFTEKR